MERLTAEVASAVRPTHPLREPAMRRQLVLVVLLLVTLPVPAAAGIIFGKKGTKPTPQERVPELIKIVLTDGDENKRADACVELRQYDAAQFPEIVPALIDALM